MSIKITGGSAYATTITEANTAERNFTLIDQDVRAGMYRGTAYATTSGTTSDWTSLPTGIKRITVSFYGFSTNGTSAVLLQIGTGGVPVATGYAGGNIISNSAGNNLIASATGFCPSQRAAAGDTLIGHATITNPSANIWVFSSTGYRENTTAIVTGSGALNLGGVLNMVRLTTVSGDTFDAGVVTLSYE